MATWQEAVRNAGIPATVLPSETWQPDERRCEQRIVVDSIPALIRVSSDTIHALVLDISISGVRLVVDRCVPVDAEVTVAFNSTIALGRIRYCRPIHQDGSFQLGLLLEDVLNTV